MQTNDLLKIELFEKELFDHLTVCKQMTEVKGVSQYLELFDFVDFCLQILYI